MSSILSDKKNSDEKNPETDCDSTVNSSVISIVSGPNAEKLSPTQQTCQLVAKGAFVSHPCRSTATSPIIPSQVQLTPLQISPISMQSQSTPTSPIGTQTNQYESREILQKIETKSKEMSEEYIQYERERRRNYARLLREKKRAHVKELEDRAAFLEKENKRLRKNLEIYHARLAYAGIISTPFNNDISFSDMNIYNSTNNFVPCVSTVPEFSFLPLENNITPEEILNMPMGFNDLNGDNLIEDKDQDLGYFGR
ncbi:8890_t:CDS:2 [Cetraspora pellucida]|uniref:8890_t:CDS:1 n=1 Tax=Cetraspora pellucida TaxID=1433469 RepID=A0A9N9J8F3_9GLOM|nr:8890_t:CDS:2 [Cetraspora pellucida]